jgi:YfiH family protein
MLEAPNLKELDWLRHGFGLRDTVPPEGLITVRQIHSGIVSDAACPAPEGDALISNRAGVLVAVKTADCVPILLADPVTRSVAAVHAGWRGTAAGIVANAIAQMSEKWGAHPADLHAAIGPAIGRCCYEVGADVARRFSPWNQELAQIEIPVHVDLPRINEIQLREMGVGNIWQADECTFCAAERYFSFRRDREQAGRMFSFIGLS